MLKIYYYECEWGFIVALNYPLKHLYIWLFIELEGSKHHIYQVIGVGGGGLKLTPHLCHIRRKVTFVNRIRPLYLDLAFITTDQNTF